MSGFTPSPNITISGGDLASLNNKFSEAITLSDGYANFTSTLIGSGDLVYNGSTWDRMRGSLAGVSSGTVSSFTGYAHTLGFARYLATRPTLTDGQGSHLHSNTRGDLTIAEQFSPQYEDNTNQVAWTSEKPLAVSTNALSVSDNINVTGAVVKASPGRIYMIMGYNGNAAVRHVQIYNTTAIPADAAVPAMTFPVAANSSFSISFGNWGRYHSVGICIATSTTLATKTLGAADLTVSVFYL